MNPFEKRFMLVMLAHVILALEILVMSVITPSSADCHAAGAAYLKLILQSQRNATGHRNVKVLLQSRATPGSSAADLSGVEATQNVRLCDGVEVIDTWATITAPPARVRLPDYDVFPGLGYYKFHTKSVTWDEAYSICESEGTHLMFINSEAEGNVVKQFLNRKVTVIEPTTGWNGWSWAGFHDRGLEGDYRTVLGGPLNETGYTKWHPGQPDNKPWGIEPDQDCGAFNNNALLNDLPCTGKLPFICEQPI